MRHQGALSRLGRYCAVVAALLVGGSTADAQRVSPQAKGGKPGGGGTTTLAPTIIGDSKGLGCSAILPQRINGAASALVVGYALGCETSEVPFVWSASSGATTGDSLGGRAMAVSDSGVILGFSVVSSQPVEFDELGRETRVLPMPSGFTSGEVYGLTADGTVAAGSGWNGTSDYPLLWQRMSTADPWDEAVVLDSNGGGAVAIADLGAGAFRVAGYGPGNDAVVWTGSITSGWTKTVLPKDSGERRRFVSDINEDGTIVIGYHDVPLPKDPTNDLQQPVVWIHDGTQWNLVVLPGADPNFSEGQAYGIANQDDGSVVAVGYAWEDTPGKKGSLGGTMWAVAWRWAVGAAGFATPIKLQPISKGTWGGAAAVDVNRHGTIVGQADTGLTRVAVIWTLK